MLDAIAHRAGWHERHLNRTVTGLQAPRITVQPPPDRDFAVGLVDDADQLPTFEDIRQRTYALLGDAADWLRSDWRPGTGPTAAAADGVQRAFAALDAAKTALNEAAR